MFKGLFRPSIGKILLVFPFIVLFWFFPIFSRTVVAIPFIEISSLAFSLVMNLLTAYFFSCLIINNLNDRRRLILVISIIILVYLLIPKVASFYVGDLGGMTRVNCDCYGLNWSVGSCCYSSVNYCAGVCSRNENIVIWDWGE